MARVPWRPIRLGLLLVLTSLLYFGSRVEVPWDVQERITERCLPPLELEASIQRCLTDFATSPETNERDGRVVRWRDRSLFDCMARVGMRTSGRVWGVPMPACVVRMARVLGQEDPYASQPPCPEEVCGMKAQMREARKWSERLCRALYPDGPPPGCG